VSPAVIDACCLIDLLVSGNADGILQAAGFAWHLPDAVQVEVRYVRQHDPKKPGQTVSVPADLTRRTNAGSLQMCQPNTEHELDRFTRYATQFRSDGEAMCLAIAESRAWTVATDDRKAIRVAQEAGLTVVSCPQLVKTWADKTKPAEAMLRKVLQDIQTLAQFRPNPSMPQYRWWVRIASK
jgi:hypothetical protein